MKAKLVPYESKYYGTKVEIHYSDNEDDFAIKMLEMNKIEE